MLLQITVSKIFQWWISCEKFAISEPWKWSWKITNFTLICSENKVKDMGISKIVSKWISCEKWSWKITNLVMESHEISYPRFRGNPTKVRTVFLYKCDKILCSFLLLELCLWYITLYWHQRYQTWYMNVSFRHLNLLRSITLRPHFLAQALPKL